MNIRITDKVKAILWDNDGVLVDTENLFFEATKKTLASFGFDLTRELFVEYSLIKGSGFKEYLSEFNFDTAQYETYREKRSAEYTALLQTGIALLPGINETLKSLYNSYKMGIVTSSRKSHFDIIHKETDILQYFDFILTREDYTSSKPNPEPYLKGLEMAGVKPEECIVIEDSARGLKAANLAGIFCLMLPNDLSRPETYEGDYKLLSHPREIRAFLDAY